MNDKERADALVGRGIVDRLTMPYGCTYQFPAGEPSDGVLFLTEAALVTDWRVAGACLERMDKPFFMEGGVVITHSHYTENGEPICVTAEVGESLPRAIIDAFLETEV